jgi:LysM repeat protein
MKRWSLLLIALIALLIPAAAQEDSTLPITADVRYTVVAGDTLDAVGAYFDVRIGCIREDNDLRPADLLQPGQELLISVDCPAYDGVNTVTVQRPNAPGRDGADGSYAVKPNDTLDQIAQDLNISVEALAVANGITSGRSLLAGQFLMIPAGAPPYGEIPAIIVSQGLVQAQQLSAQSQAAPSIPGESYSVAAGDTLDSIAQQFDISIVTLRVVNNLGLRADVEVDTLLFIPEGATTYGNFPPREETLRFSEAIASAQSAAPAFATYTVQRNETLDGIGAKLNVNHYCLIERNQITNVRLVLPGTQLLVPQDCGPYTGFDFVPQS